MWHDVRTRIAVLAADILIDKYVPVVDPLSTSWPQCSIAMSSQERLIAQKSESFAMIHRSIPPAL